MTVHMVPMPASPHLPTCLCGWTYPRALACTWDAWDAAVTEHLHPTRNKAGRWVHHTHRWRCGWCVRWVGAQTARCPRCGRDEERP